MEKRACDRLRMVLDRWSISRDALRQQGRSRAYRSFIGKEKEKGRKGKRSKHKTSGLGSRSMTGISEMCLA